MDKNILVKFWGVRGSYPVPGAGTVRFGGNTACVEVRANGQTIILDTGTGSIALGRDLALRANKAGNPIHASIFYTHLHQDHLQGFPFFAPAYIPASQLTLFGPVISGQSLQEMLARTMGSPSFPISLHELGASLTFYTLQETDLVLLGDSVGGVRLQKAIETTGEQEAVIVRIMRSYAHPGGVLIYRIEWGGHAVVLATDTEGYVGTDRRLADFARGADLLIHDAQYSEDHYHGHLPGVKSTQGFGHSTASMACDVAAAAGVRELALFHHDPLYNDETIASIEDAARKSFPATTAAFEGLEILIEGSDSPVNCLSAELKAGWRSRSLPLVPGTAH